MKTVNNSKTGNILESAKRILSSFQVLTIGLLIPFLFVFGISYNTPKDTSKDGINISKSQEVVSDKVTIDFNQYLSDQNS
ncbi:MAG: hypothetical protein ABI261_00115 [Ginsengibacter sp.]